jgi:hypothetical protein
MMGRVLSFNRFGPAFVEPVPRELDIPAPPLSRRIAGSDTLCQSYVCCRDCASWTACWAAERCRKPLGP